MASRQHPGNTPTKRPRRLLAFRKNAPAVEGGSAGLFCAAGLPPKGRKTGASEGADWLSRDCGLLRLPQLGRSGRWQADAVCMIV